MFWIAKEGSSHSWLVTLPSQLAFDELNQRTYCGKSTTLDFVIVDSKAETILKAGDQGNNGHRIEFGHCPQQEGTGSEFCRAPFQTQDFIEKGQHFFFGIQALLQRCQVLVAAL
jgi:hypothetical protein